MKEYLDLVVAVSLKTYKDLIKGYKQNDKVLITECESFFTSNCSLFAYLKIDGDYIIKQARESAKNDK